MKIDNLIILKKFSENFEYNIDDNKFNLRQYEKNIKLKLSRRYYYNKYLFLASVIMILKIFEIR